MMNMISIRAKKANGGLIILKLNTRSVSNKGTIKIAKPIAGADCKGKLRFIFRI